MEEAAALFGRGGDFRHRLQAPGLVVGVHDRDQQGLVVDQLLDSFEKYGALGVDRGVRDLDAELSQMLAGVPYRVVLDGGGHDAAGACYPRRGLPKPPP